MYLSSDSPLLQGQRDDAARAAAASDCRRDKTRRMMASGRAQMFQTLIDPAQIADALGIPAGVNAQIMQDATTNSRQALLSNGDSLPAPDGSITLAELIANAPEVTSLNAQADQFGCSDVIFSQRPLAADPTPGMPQRAPAITGSPYGPLYFKGAPATAYPQNPGLTGYAPAWSDAWVMPDQMTPAPVSGEDSGVMGWIRSNPLLAIALAGAGVFALAQTGRKRR